VAKMWGTCIIHDKVGKSQLF